MKQVIELKRKTYEELQQTVIELITEKCLLEKEIKHLKDRKDYYKHEYFAVCDLLEKMEKALDEACLLLDEMTDEGSLLCPSEYLGICCCMTTDNGYECYGDIDFGWKDAILEKVKQNEQV